MDTKKIDLLIEEVGEDITQLVIYSAFSVGLFMLIGELVEKKKKAQS
ncbi:MAG: hypothetical protein LBH40_05975 [Alphaproteobacteria bacterium]|jgi:hypothetical protein|nr:hypothetical protein [Alphaproteobacteria bacterium]